MRTNIPIQESASGVRFVKPASWLKSLQSFWQVVTGKKAAARRTAATAVAWFTPQVKALVRRGPGPHYPGHTWLRVETMSMVLEMLANTSSFLIAEEQLDRYRYHGDLEQYLHDSRGRYDGLPQVEIDRFLDLMRNGSPTQAIEFISESLDQVEEQILSALLEQPVSSPHSASNTAQHAAAPCTSPFHPHR